MSSPFFARLSCLPLAGLRASLAAALLAGLCACGGGSSDGQADTPGTVSPPQSESGPIEEVNPGVPQRTASFKATDAEFSNPERGFFRWSSGKLNALTASDVQSAYQQGYRLLYTQLDLSAYRGSDLPDSLLTQLDTAFARARSGGVKLVVRASYNYPSGETDYANAQDAPLSRVLRHITQLKPVLQSNADVIAFLQAGFIGAWGEWHTSSNNLTAAASRNQIRDALLDALPSSRFLQMRYPGHVMEGTPTLPALAAVLNGGLRVGVHNDCFLSSATDVGTYDTNATRRAAQQAYTDGLGDLAPFGGETCNPAGDSNPTPRSTCADILAEGARYNLTYLNYEYYRPLFHTKWEEGNCMAEMRRSMGYRLQLASSSHAESVARGQALGVTATVRNVGWARVFNPRSVQVLLRDSAGTVRRVAATGADPRAWTAGASHTARLRITVPADLAPGAYEVWLALPDADSRLADDVRYAIRVANADDTAAGQRWDATLGAFALGTSVQVQ